jgi:hypothetical protein
MQTYLRKPKQHKISCFSECSEILIGTKGHRLPVVQDFHLTWTGLIFMDNIIQRFLESLYCTGSMLIYTNSISRLLNAMYRYSMSRLSCLFFLLLFFCPSLLVSHSFFHLFLRPSRAWHYRTALCLLLGGRLYR